MTTLLARTRVKISIKEGMANTPRPLFLSGAISIPLVKPIKQAIFIMNKKIYTGKISTPNLYNNSNLK